MIKNTSYSEIEADFQRNIYAILGLPIDAVDLDEAAKIVISAIDDDESLFISTPNLNFLVASQTDSAFRQSVINSDLSLADGMPLIWIARLLGVPLKERTAGSDLIEMLMHSEDGESDPIKVFFFGGDDGIAELACKRLLKHPCGMHCVGSFNPGFGSVEEMSDPLIIERINQSDPQFVVVSLGAKKGQEWIERNRRSLKAPVISHLGAVVNFIAETVNRAPQFWQRYGMEWLWRLKEEPSLWKRYFLDGWSFSRLLFTRVFPYAMLMRRNRDRISSASPFSISCSCSESNKTVRINGNISAVKSKTVRDLFVSLVPGDDTIRIELDESAYIDPCFCGLLLLLYKHVGIRLTVMTKSSQVKKILFYNGMDFLMK